MKIYAIATGAAVALALVVAPSASAAVKEGAACKKAGQSSTVSGRKFTCVKKMQKFTAILRKLQTSGTETQITRLPTTN